MIMLRSLKLYGMANAIEDLVAQGAPAFEAATPMLSQLLKAEIAEREVRSIAYHTKVARFPAYKDLTGFDFASSEINEATVRQLHRCEFIEAAENVVFLDYGDQAAFAVVYSAVIQDFTHFFVVADVDCPFEVGVTSGLRATALDDEDQIFALGARFEFGEDFGPAFGVEAERYLEPFEE